MASTFTSNQLDNKHYQINKSILKKLLNKYQQKIKNIKYQLQLKSMLNLRNESLRKTKIKKMKKSLIYYYDLIKVCIKLFNLREHFIQDKNVRVKIFYPNKCSKKFKNKMKYLLTISEC
ncbi:hypothetical protein BNATCHR188 (nucleomorph) [Bigelowiella natans]|uniref:Uncharacterized protein n=1 Tax=Bigelowiella natans TaxID=227086 RepID=Q3LWK9_BIGNA|nr:hypothetical protein BNATCHR188 [Bigelowiella natans]ABA27156.1 hypothetical protein [Bigelowiella natans]